MTEIQLLKAMIACNNEHIAQLNAQIWKLRRLNIMMADKGERKCRLYCLNCKRCRWDGSECFCTRHAKPTKIDGNICKYFDGRTKK